MSKSCHSMYSRMLWDACLFVSAVAHQDWDACLTHILFIVHLFISDWSEHTLFACYLDFCLVCYKLMHLLTLSNYIIYTVIYFNIYGSLLSVCYPARTINILLVGPYYAGPKSTLAHFTPALIPPRENFDLPPFRAAFNATIRKIRKKARFSIYNNNYFVFNVFFSRRIKFSMIKYLL